WSRASCSSSSRLASLVRHRPRSRGIESRKTMIPPKQIQYQVFHWPTVLAAGGCTARAWAGGGAVTDGGTLDSAVSCALYGAMAVSSAEYGAMVFSWAEYGAMVVRSAAYGATVCSCGPTAMTPLIAALLAAIVESTPTPLAPPPAAATACACRVVL